MARICLLCIFYSDCSRLSALGFNYSADTFVWHSKLLNNLIKSANFSIAHCANCLFAHDMCEIFAPFGKRQKKTQLKWSELKCWMKTQADTPTSTILRAKKDKISAAQRGGQDMKAKFVRHFGALVRRWFKHICVIVLTRFRLSNLTISVRPKIFRQIDFLLPCWCLQLSWAHFSLASPRLALIYGRGWKSYWNRNRNGNVYANGALGNAKFLESSSVAPAMA